MENKFRTYNDLRSHHNLLVEPLTLDELKQKATKAGVIKVHLALDFDLLVENDGEWLGDEVSERITGSVAGLMDIEYDVMGNEGRENVIVRVTGSVQEYIDELEQELEEAEQYGQ